MILFLLVLVLSWALGVVVVVFFFGGWSMGRTRPKAVSVVVVAPPFLEESPL